ncbi:MAG TPA: glycosyltransferase family 1 protein [Saprospiraceae bacterium]|nr:glycosyltransferase family 1 protein [Saprospiraceae bacterium]
MNHNKNLDIIYMTLFPWDNEYSSVSLSFTKEFSKNNRVFYINHPYSIKDYWKNRKTAIAQKRKKALLNGKMQYEKVPGLDSQQVIAIQPPLTLPINWLPHGAIYHFFYKINRRRILKTIQKVIDDYHIENYVYLNCFDPFFVGSLPKDKFSPRLNIYQCIDDFAIEPYSAKHGLPLEDIAIKESDVVVVTSSNLVKIKKHLNGNIHLLPNAVDLTIFEKAISEKLPKPKEMAHIETKVIGFTGNMDNVRFDFKLVKKLAEAHQDKTLVLVGPINCDEFYTLGMDKIPNIITTGSKNIKELPAYLQHFDVTIIPFALNRQTESIYPLKINEYLAAGKAIVSTSFSEDIKTFADWIYLAKDENHFLELIDIAIAENDEKKIAARLAKAKTNTWTERVKSFWSIVNKNLS